MGVAIRVSPPRNPNQTDEDPPLEDGLAVTIPPRALPGRLWEHGNPVSPERCPPAPQPLAREQLAVPWLTAPVLLSSLPATVCFLRAFYYLAPLVSDLVAFLSSRINSFSCTPLLPLR